MPNVYVTQASAIRSASDLIGYQAFASMPRYAGVSTRPSGSHTMNAAGSRSYEHQWRHRRHASLSGTNRVLAQARPQSARRRPTVRRRAARAYALAMGWLLELPR